MFSGGIGLPEVILVLLIVLVIFGPKRLPALGKSLGSGMRNFKDSVSRSHDDDEDDEGKPELTRAQASPNSTSTTTAAETRAEAESATGHPGEDEVVTERRV